MSTSTPIVSKSINPNVELTRAEKRLISLRAMELEKQALLNEAMDMLEEVKALESNVVEDEYERLGVTAVHLYEIVGKARFIAEYAPLSARERLALLVQELNAD